jgi:1,4-dihydroxy-2-naphthoate octaprenyltransferase
MKHWIEAFRLRTLPLALASIGMGTFLAASAGFFDGLTFALCALTTIFLQVLSNLANDYGDSVHGADSASRVGPSRAVQSGLITKTAMKRAIVLCSILSLLAGVALIYTAFGWSPAILGIFLGFGILAILAAITYTAGFKPYGYAGLGDLSVLIFFGFMAVMGSAYLYDQTIHWDYVWPSLSTGLFSVGVLNLNNIRDIDSDREAGKMSIPVRLGRKKAVVYHWSLLLIGFLSALIYVELNSVDYWQYLFVLTLPLLIKNGLAVQTKTNAVSLDPYLKQMALTTLFFVILFGLGQILLL